MIQKNEMDYCKMYRKMVLILDEITNHLRSSMRTIISQESQIEELKSINKSILREAELLEGVLVIKQEGVKRAELESIDNFLQSATRVFESPENLALYFDGLPTKIIYKDTKIDEDYMGRYGKTYMDNRSWEKLLDGIKKKNIEISIYEEKTKDEESSSI